MEIKLSICIPTYNFGDYIGETLACFISQIEPGMEIVVLDGGSTDNTREVVSKFQKDYACIIYHRQDFKGGIDKDIAKVVSLARGKYCWLMSSDDLIKPGALRRILLEIESGNDLYLCNRVECDINMKPIWVRYNLKKNVKDRVFNLQSNLDLRNYLNLSLSIGALLCYMSSIIFKKSRWDQVADKEYAYGTCYNHAYILLSLIQDSRPLTFKYLHDPLILCRGGNDSFSKDGFLKRVLIDFDGYKKITDKIFIDDLEMNVAFKGVLKKTYPLYRLLKLRAFSNDSEWREIRLKLIDMGCKPSTILICDLLKYTGPVIIVLIKIKQIFRRI